MKKLCNNHILESKFEGISAMTVLQSGYAMLQAFICYGCQKKSEL